MSRTLFVTTALPYANGSLHIGHIMEYIQADIWVRSMRMAGHTVYFIGADDVHGAPIMLKAKQKGITPKELVLHYISERPKYLKGFHIQFDHWDLTSSPENIELSYAIYYSLKDHNMIEIRPIVQFYDPCNNMFLADRYIKGECPKCHAKNQYGDSCEICGSVYTPMELIQPYSDLTGAKPVLKESDHVFFKLSDQKCIKFLEEWIVGTNHMGNKRLQKEVQAKILEWLNDQDKKNKLKDWDISRDLPYFGIEIPDFPGKYFYVWLDATVGYLSSLKSYCNLNGINFNELIDPNGSIEQIHFIGKDIIYFHALFWPAILKFSGRKTPDVINVHGFVTIKGKKISKRYNTDIFSPIQYLKSGMNPEWLRYYIATKLNNKPNDINLDPDEFITRINSDLIGKYINIASRSSMFITKYFGGNLAYQGDIQSLIDEINIKIEDVRRFIENLEYNRAIRYIMNYANYVNQLFDLEKPWLLVKEISKEFDSFRFEINKKKQLQYICSRALARFKALTIMLTPILPELSRKISKEFFNEERWFLWNDSIILPKYVLPFKHLMQRIDSEKLNDLFKEA